MWQNILELLLQSFRGICLLISPNLCFSIHRITVSKCHSNIESTQKLLKKKKNAQIMGLHFRRDQVHSGWYGCRLGLHFKVRHNIDFIFKRVELDSLRLGLSRSVLNCGLNSCFPDTVQLAWSPAEYSMKLIWILRFCTGEKKQQIF